MHYITIFGYGSLLNIDSLKSSAPNASNIRTCFIQGFERKFCLWAPTGFQATDFDLKGQPFCALDVYPASANQIVNGIAFDVGAEDFHRLCERECEYQRVSTVSYDFGNGVLSRDIIVFTAGKNNALYDHQSESQKRYLEVCLDGAKSHGDSFYQQFLDTSYIDDDQTLRSYLM